MDENDSDGLNCPQGSDSEELELSQELSQASIQSEYEESPVRKRCRLYMSPSKTQIQENQINYPIVTQVECPMIEYNVLSEETTPIPSNLPEKKSNA